MGWGVWGGRVAKVMRLLRSALSLPGSKFTRVTEKNRSGWTSGSRRGYWSQPDAEPRLPCASGAEGQRPVLWLRGTESAAGSCREAAPGPGTTAHSRARPLHPPSVGPPAPRGVKPTTANADWRGGTVRVQAYLEGTPSSGVRRP